MFLREQVPSGAMDMAAGGSISIVENIQPGLNLYLPLKSPMQMPALAAAIEAVKPRTLEALQSLHYVHFARFLPAWDYSALWVITVFDGSYDVAGDPDAYNDSMTSYVMDFVATMGDVFTAILDFVQDAPRLPVNEYPRDFVDFVINHNRSNVNPWSAYPEMTVLDIQTARSIR
jgi:hypothetical protein